MAYDAIPDKLFYSFTEATLHFCNEAAACPLQGWASYASVFSRPKVKAIDAVGSEKPRQNGEMGCVLVVCMLLGSLPATCLADQCSIHRL